MTKGYCGEAGGKGDFGDGLVTRVANEQIARARNNPLLVDVLADRAAGCRKQAMHIAFGAAESCSQCCRAELRIVAVTIDMVNADPDKDKTLTKDEYLTVVEKRFKAADTDNDGTVSAEEFGTAAGRALARLLH